MSLKAQELELVELLPVEKYFYYTTFFGDQNVICINICNLETNVLEDDVVKQAMFYMYKRHPLLRAHIRTDIKKIFFAIPKTYEKQVDDMSFERCQVNSREELISECEKFNSKIFKYEEVCLLWRLKIVEFKEKDRNMVGLLLVIPTYVSDGCNITALSIEFINLINSLLQNKECNEMIEHLDVLDNVMKIIEKNNLIEQKHRDEFEKFKNTELNVEFVLSKTFRNIKDHGLKINLLALNKDFSKSLSDHARSKQTKLTSLFTVASFYAFKELYEENGLRIQKDFTVSIPVNMRFRVEPNIDFSHVRACVTCIELNLLYPNFGKFEDLWSDTKYVNDLLHEKIKNHENLYMLMDDTFEVMEKVIHEESSDFDEAIKILSNSANSDFVLTNIGAYVACKKPVIDGALKLEECYFGDSVTADISYVSSFILHISSFDDRIMFQLSTNRYRFGSCYADRFMELFENQLRKSCYETTI